MTNEQKNQIIKRISVDLNDKDQTVYPDIIVHWQCDDKHNLLVVELKMKWKNDGKNKDYEKLKEYTTELKYKFGLYLELGESDIVEMSWFQDGKTI